MGRFEINSRKPSTFEVAVKGTRQIRVILYAKGDLGARAPADELSVEDILAIEHDVIPLDGADVFQQGEIDSIGDRVAPAEAERFPAADASTGPPVADSTSQRRGTERRFLSV